MKFNHENLKGNQIRPVLRAVVAMFGGTVTQADALRMGGDIRDLAYDLISLNALPEINLGVPNPKATMAANRGTGSSYKVMVEGSSLVFIWVSPKTSLDETEALGVILRFHSRPTAGVRGDDGVWVHPPEGSLDHLMDVSINLKDSWDGHNPVQAFLGQLLGDNT
jgi:hypothetical protein